MSKTQPPSTKIIIYGIEIDSEIMQARIPIDTVEKPRLAQGIMYIKRSAIPDRST